MREQHTAMLYRSDQWSQSSELPIVGQFQLNESDFFLVPLPEEFESHSTLNLGIPSHETMVGQLKHNGQTFAILKAQSSNKNNENSVEDAKQDLNLITYLTSLLTGRELQVAALVAIGRSNKQIASRLKISEWTVSSHLRRIFIKLNVDSRAAMVYRCAPLIQYLHQLCRGQSANAASAPLEPRDRQNLQQCAAEIGPLL